MKVLFVSVYAGVPHFPIGIGSISSMLRAHGHETKLCGIECSQSPEVVANMTLTWQPDILGFTSMSSMFEWVKELSFSMRQQFNEAFQVCGGIHPTLVPQCIEEAPFDAIYRGEGEYGFLELIEKRCRGEDHRNVEGFWFKENGNIIKNPPRPLIQDLDKLPMPDHDIYQSSEMPNKIEGQGEFMFYRGCPFDCTYCSNHAIKKMYQGQRYVRYPSVGKAIDELVYVKWRHGIRNLAIHDDIFSLNKKWFYDFCSEYKEKVNIPFVCCIRPGTCTEDMFRVLKRANCESVSIGVESGNPYIREKVLDRKMTNGEIIETFRLAREAGLQTSPFIMIGLPYETRRALVDTVKLTARLGDHNKIQRYIFHPYPETKLAKLCQEKGWAAVRPPGFEERSKAVLNLPSMKLQDIQNYFDHFGTLVKVETLALSKEKYSIARFFTNFFMFPRLFVIVKMYYRLHNAKRYGIRECFRRISVRLISKSRSSWLCILEKTFRKI